VRGLLVRCCSPPSLRVDDLEEWLVHELAQLGRDEAVLYRDRRGATAAPGPKGPAQVWFVSLSGAAAGDRSRVRDLLLGMRLLGLNPVVYGQNPSPNDGEDAAGIS